MKNLSKWLFAIGLSLIWSLSFSQTTHTFNVGGACGMCQDRIEQVASFIPGVKSANYDLKNHTLTVIAKTKDFDIMPVHQALAKAGYDTDLLQADEEDYQSLDGCCHYRELGFSPQSGQNIQSDPEKMNTLSSTITGTVLENGPDGQKVPLIGANITWLGAPVGAITDEHGYFEIGRIAATDYLVISYIGYAPDTLDMSMTSSLEWMMSDDVVLTEIEVSHRRKSSEVSFVDPIQTIKISEEELCKAACCNLSESFETNPSIDVSFTDAVTGTRQIQMLGLAGKYVQITRELIPDIRGLASIFGLTYTPGAWIQSIQLSKGTGSVVNGHESLTGQINVELRKPQTKERFYLNLYGNEGGRYEGNLAAKHKFSENLSTALLLHGSTRQERHDRNEDGFLDMPIGKDLIVINRWKYQNANGFQGQVGVKVSQINRTSGEVRYQHDLDYYSDKIWGSENETRRYEAWMKIGKVFNETKNQSVGFQLSGSTHDQDLIFGRRKYISSQNGLYANLIYQTNFISPHHSYKIGASFVLDDIEEIVDLQFYEREEMTQGVFAEYTYTAEERFTSVLGIRADNHNSYGIMVTPRVHLRFAPSESTVFRAIAGKGWRTANILAENIGLFATSRDYRVLPTETGNPYDLKPEQAWNFGLNVTQEIYLGKRSAVITADYYYTLFEDQIVADWESDAEGSVILTNQSDASDGHSIQTQLDVELFPRLDMRAAYRYNFNQAKFGDRTETLPLSSFHRAFVNLAYETQKQWHFDLTVNWKGKQRLPGTDWLPQEDRLEEFSPDYFLVNCQVRKIFNDNFELYSGVENLMDFTQDNPIINADDPFGDHFDASMIWGPIFGRNIYAGLRYRLD